MTGACRKNHRMASTRPSSPSRARKPGSDGWTEPRERGGSGSRSPRSPPPSGRSASQALEIALCYGWIDGQRKAFDEDYFLQRFTPRRGGAGGRRSTATAPRRSSSGEGCGRRARRGRACAGRRPLGGRVCSPAIQPTPELLAALERARRRRSRSSTARSVRDPVPRPRRQAARDPDSPHRDVRRDAEQGETPYPRR